AGRRAKPHRKLRVLARPGNVVVRPRHLEGLRDPLPEDVCPGFPGHDLGRSAARPASYIGRSA
ncbi:MAG: hypothetical protein NT125_00265, partial [Candidatus Bipolaricaulota bacterium]|nr:hypothetical protein [Candidatus Bipolaricaulota bacterium]